MTPEELTARREALHLSRPELAERLSVPLSTLWRWETGERRIPPYLALAIAALEHGITA